MFNLTGGADPAVMVAAVIFSAPGVREIVSVPAKRPIKPVYTNKFVALIDAAGGIGTK